MSFNWIIEKEKEGYHFTLNSEFNSIFKQFSNQSISVKDFSYLG